MVTVLASELSGDRWRAVFFALTCVTLAPLDSLNVLHREIVHGGSPNCTDLMRKFCGARKATVQYANTRMMKDVQGIQRGKCNTCDCEEYRSPPIPGQLRCEYCDHTPAEHVRIVELGACKQCGEDDCDKYVSDEPNSYSDCQYCGCSANQHEGSDACKFLTSQAFFCQARWTCDARQNAGEGEGNENTNT